MICLFILAGLLVFNNTVTPPSANLLDESFNTGTGAGPGGLGYDNTWTEVISAGTVEEDITTGCGTGTGWSGECLKIDLVTFDDANTRSAFTAQTGNVWFHGRLKNVFDIPNTDDNKVGILSLSNATGPDELGAAVIRVRRSAGPVYNYVLFSGSGGVLDTATATSTETICIELYMNNTSNAWEWWINGVSQGSHASSGDWSIDPTNLWLGSISGISVDDSQTQYWDEVQVGNTGRLTCL